MIRTWLALACLLAGVARGQAPSYSVSNFVNAGDYSAGPFAPNSIVSVYGSNLARSAQNLTAGDIKSGSLPLELNYTQVFVEGSPAPLFYVSPTQVNFLIPARQFVGPTHVRVMREGTLGPDVILSLADAAPALFAGDGGFAVATHADNITPVTAAAPARPGETIVIWAAGLGKATVSPQLGELAVCTCELANKSLLKVTLNGVAVDPSRIWYAGLTPGAAGLYQINLTVPDNAGNDPLLQVALGAQASTPGLKLAVH